MTLKQAVKEVIEQNKSVGYNPQRFRMIVQNGNASNLEEIIDRLIMKAELLEELEKVIKTNKKVITIEDLVAESKSGLGLSVEVQRMAKARSQYFHILRQKNKTYAKRDRKSVV